MNLPALIQEAVRFVRAGIRELAEQFTLELKNWRMTFRNRRELPAEREQKRNEPNQGKEHP